MMYPILKFKFADTVYEWYLLFVAIKSIYVQKQVMAQIFLND